MSESPSIESLLPAIVGLHDRIRIEVGTSMERSSLDALARVEAETEGDTIFAIDRIAEKVLIEQLERELAPDTPIVLIAEGIEGGSIVLPRDASEDDAVWRVIVDPIDGTRGLMVQKRPAWILTGVAPNRGPETSLRDVVLAVQTEIPLVKQYEYDRLWATRGKGVGAARYAPTVDEPLVFEPIPSRAKDLYQGFVSFSRFFPGTRDAMAEIDEEVVREVLGTPAEGKALCFEDQYISTGGQLYELCVGHDRFVADLRPVLAPLHAERGLPRPLCCHPYDLAAVLIAEELGIEITDERGRPLDAPLCVDADVSWVGYANADIRSRVEPVLLDALRRRELIPPE